VVHEVAIHGTKDQLRDLCAGGIVEKYEGTGLLQGDKLGSQCLHGKLLRAEATLPRYRCIHVWRIHVALRGNPAVTLG